MARFDAALSEKIAERIGYAFSDRTLLRRALTHTSGKGKSRRDDYERLEFLGDRVLGLVIAEHLYRSNPGAKEGVLASRHSALVRGEVCAAVGLAIGLDGLLLVGEGERAKGMSTNATVLGDAMEALIAAIYLDGGIEAARTFILRHWDGFVKDGALMEKDPKTFLQEWVLARALPIPVYRVLSREGPEHEPVFKMIVEVAGKIPAEGTGKSKRAAEQDAAERFLKRERIRK